MKNKTQKANETEHHDGRVDTNDQIQLFFGGWGRYGLGNLLSN